MNQGSELLIERQDVVMRITLNRPETLNALTRGMLKDLRKALRKAAGDSGIRAIVLTGSGRGFCVGADLAQFQEEKKAKTAGFRRELEDNFHPIARSIRALPQIVLGRINGTCAGAGLAIALSCDIKYALREASFVAAFAKVGLVPDTGSSYLVAKAMGYSKALEFFLTQGKATGQELTACGLVNKVFDTLDALDEGVVAFLKQLTELPPQAVTLTKRALGFASQARYFNEALSYEAAAQDYLGRTADHAEGVAAFIEKRKPVFIGR